MIPFQNCSQYIEKASLANGNSEFANPLQPSIPSVSLPTIPDLPILPTTPGAVNNLMKISDSSGNGMTNYPLQFARPFKAGEIANFPQVLINGVPVFTQADVKTRFPDSSVKHAIISVIIPKVLANDSVTLTFQNQLSGNNTPLNAAQMLIAGFNFDATMLIASGGLNKSVSARQMLQDGNFTYWTSGPLATTIILADHSAARIYDIGFDSYRSLRPIIHATFWPSQNLVKVRFVGENANTTTLQDINYQLTLKTGLISPTTVYTNANLNHYFATRWTKTFWLGSAPSAQVNIDYSVAYLGDTQSFPNYDSNMKAKLSEIILANDYSLWKSKARDLYDAAYWTKYMPTTGGRADIGLFPRWTTSWFITGDWRAREIAFGQAELASAWPLHFREGAPALFLDRAGTAPALGKPISGTAHPDLWLPDNNGVYSIRLPTPRITTPPSTDTFGGWVADGAHQPDAFSAQYALTGDYFYLEEMQLWAAAGVVAYAPGLYGRGATGYAGIQDQIRGNGWVFRNRVNAAFFSPDQSPEKEYFKLAVNDAIALWEAQHQVSSPLQSHPNWIWADKNIRINIISPQHFWFDEATGAPPAPAGEMNTSVVLNFEALWMDNYFLNCLGAAKEKGFAVGPLFTYYAKLVNSQFAEPSFDPHLGGAYHTPVQKLDRTYFSSWTEIQNSGYTSTNIADILSSYNASFDGSTLETAAAAFTVQEQGGTAAWNWLYTNSYTKVDYTGEYLSWAILPRAVGTPPLPAP